MYLHKGEDFEILFRTIEAKTGFFDIFHIVISQLHTQTANCEG
jgi:hypothetical protein